MNEWRPVYSYPGLYEVNAAGLIRNARTGQIISTYYHRDGYLLARLYKNGKRKVLYVHIAVARAFLPKEPRKPLVNHKDGDKGNAVLENLEWVSHASNTRHAVKTGLQKCEHRPRTAVQAEPVDGVGLVFPSAAEAERSLAGKRTSEVSKAIARDRRAYGRSWCKIERLGHYSGRSLISMCCKRAFFDVVSI